jgi:hypothetical protein
MDLYQLKDYEIIIGINDTKGLNTVVEKMQNNKERTHWTEMQDKLIVILNIMKGLNKTVDIYFMNRSKISNVNNFDQLYGHLYNPHTDDNALSLKEFYDFREHQPQKCEFKDDQTMLFLRGLYERKSFTSYDYSNIKMNIPTTQKSHICNSHSEYSYTSPLTAFINYIIDSKKKIIKKKKCLLIIITNAKSKDEMNISIIDSLEESLKAKPDNLFVSIVACTKNNRSYSYFDKLRNKINNYDVSYDYISERNKIKYAQGNNFIFTFNDYVSKILLGPIDNYYYTLNETILTKLIKIITNNIFFIIIFIFSAIYELYKKN